MSFLISEMIRECKLQTNYALYSKNVCNFYIQTILKQSFALIANKIAVFLLL